MKRPTRNGAFDRFEKLTRAIVSVPKAEAYESETKRRKPKPKKRRK